MMDAISLVPEYESMKIFEGYVVGFVTNFPEGRTLDQIHRHLQNFVIHPKYDKTQDQLESFLAALIDRGKLAQFGGHYKLVL